MKNIKFIILAIILNSCVHENITQYGNIRTLENNGKERNFMFLVNDDELKKIYEFKYSNKKDIISKIEIELLEQLLHKHKLCTKKNKLKYQIKSKQEKIYDKTFSHLIRQNYNLRPSVPTTYFGKCIEIK